MDNKPVIGLLGGGQLGRMLCEAAGPLGFDIAILDEAGSPAKRVAENGLHIEGSFKDPVKIRELAARSDVLTVEIEHVDTEVLEDIETNGVEVVATDGTKTLKRVPVHPSWRTIRLIQDKYEQKEHYRRHGLPIADQVAIAPGDEMASLVDAGRKLGYPFMLKARKGSYDGRGNFKVSSEGDLEAAVRELKGLPLYAEKWCSFAKELAVMVVKTESAGELKSLLAYPAVETVHEDSICTKTFMPPRGVPKQACEKARETACQVISTLTGRGVFAVEMFLLDDGSILVNEVAPRPHNSGHYTIEAVPYFSQYKAQLYALLDLPLPERLTPRVPSAIMINILGGAGPKSHEKLVNAAAKTFGDSMDVYVHLYGKASKPGRKIGHITTTGQFGVVDLERHSAPLMELADAIRQERLSAATSQLRPQQPAPATAGGPTSPGALVLVTMGSDSDLPVMKAGLAVLEEFGVPFEVRITSAHRTPNLMLDVAAEAAGRGIKVAIAAAGGAAHLPGMFASHCPIPVIGVPVKATHLDGMDSLLSIVQMPRGVPVATVGINNSTNAALLAIRIIGSFIPKYQDHMRRYQLDMEDAVLAKDRDLQNIGFKGYLSKMGK
ncbi:phosphoribosylaminoimidazole carboxylase [Gaeumannomyces tritici R3-111a-1]|uniref:Phosphoribosylaminoimidazole carboxylase n=1 Tax=Gaeumannomyces tritici (strain R3-111a-1) TaxID=644352 RepID=J3P9M4_GAET3|nr:phosphoribosylaminoimidazole carboxylase [Gaeumannomyces tritici R3-111a-1]EJT73360.1 phosphoribosylaminoimidazole carboxylase [Gaeumannomyces tritici R3-111a-1]